MQGSSPSDESRVIDYPKQTPRSITFRYELQRAFAQGVLETAAGTFLLLIAIRHFQAEAMMKGLIAIGGAGGNLFSPLAVAFVASRQIPAARAASYLFLIAGGCFTVAAAIPHEIPYTLCSLLGLVFSASATPLLTQIYQDNYPEHERGKLFSRSVFIRIATAALFSYLAGWALTDRFSYYQILLAFFALMLFFSARCLWKIPSKPLARDESDNPLAAMRYVREDSTFRNALIAWMLVGFANLMMVPLRIEYLGNPIYGVRLNNLPLTAATIALLTGVIPNIARLCMSPVWGYLFDRTNFFVLRIAINLGFAVAILTFFTGNSLVGLVMGSIIFGISNAGGDLAWSLWVTKVAPPHRVAHYMSVHTFLTGLRGCVAPFVAFWMILHASLLVMALFTAGLILAACLVLIPEIALYRNRKPALIVEELPDSDT